MNRQATAGQIAAAILLPPLGVYLARGAGRDFAIDCVLTLLCWFPGVAFALWSVVHEPATPATA